MKIYNVRGIGIFVGYFYERSILIAKINIKIFMFIETIYQIMNNRSLY